MKYPDSIAHYTADEVAETIPYQKFVEGDWIGLYKKLWGFLEDAVDPTPRGGDGSNGTVEEPQYRLDEANDDKVPHFWDKLTEAEQAAIVAGVDHEEAEHAKWVARR